MAINSGQIVLIRFPQTDLEQVKLRPVFLYKKISEKYSYWLCMMITTKFSEKSDEIIELIAKTDIDFNTSGLKDESVIRILRLAVINESLFLGNIGSLSKDRVIQISSKLLNGIKIDTFAQQ